MYKKLAALAAVSMVLYGCASPAPPYVLPPDVPYANLKSSIGSPGGSMESITINMFDRAPTALADRRLFLLSLGKSRPAGYVKVPANELLTFSYIEVIGGGRSCSLDIQARLEEGKNYELVGGAAFDKGLIPILPGPRKCTLGVKEVQSRTGVSPG